MASFVPCGYRDGISPYTEARNGWIMNTPEIPIASKRPHAIDQHGHTRVDEYFWMRFREDPEVLKYLAAENSYMALTMQHTTALQERLFQEMKARIKEDDESVPERRGNYLYYTRTETGRQYRVFCRRRGSGDFSLRINPHWCGLHF